MGIIKYYDLEDFECFIFDEFIINQVKEGVLVQPEHNEVLNELVQQNSSGKHLVYISNRVKSYAVDPLIYPETEKIPNILAIAMIPSTDKMRKNAEYERNFYDKPYEIFDSLSKAIEWAHEIIANTKK